MSTHPRIALFVVVTATTIAGTAGVAAAGATFTINGKVEFEADYLAAVAGKGQIPDGHSPLPYLYVCAWDKNGAEVDYKSSEFPDVYGDDAALGCARADVDGHFTIAVTAGSARPDIYLATKLCDDVHRGAQSAADVCVRINYPEGSEDTSSNMKAIWSRVYAAQPRTDVSIAWNLSCPNKDGLGLSSLTCGALEVEPDDWDRGCPCDGYPTLGADTCPVRCGGAACGDTNSRYGCNKEAVHAFRAAVEPFKTWGSNKPDDSSTFQKSCPDSSNGRYCDADACQDEIKLHLARIQLDPNQDYHGPPQPDEDGVLKLGCAPDATQNGAGGYDVICIATPWNAMRVVHEIGHVIQKRWLCDTSGQSSEHPERKASLEGFANFTAVSAWFNADMPDPVYCAETETSCYDVERASGLTTPAESDPLSEERMTQFFWDLRDEGDDGGAEPDGQRWTYQEIRNTWSAFPTGTGDTQADEIDGLNAWDFTYHWNRKRGLTTGYCDVLDHDQVDHHTRCASCANLCQ